jgi:DNA-binding PadR family transcriptional regulator
MALPEVTHLQWLVLGTLLNGDEAGYRVREELSKHGVKKSGPAFYQLMARLEADGLVKGRYEYSVIEGQPIKERWYKLNAAGRRAWESTSEFYAAAAAAFQGGLANV